MRHLLHAAALTTAALAIPASATASPSRPYAYVTDAANGIVDVIDTTTNQVTAGIGVGSDPTDVAITPDGTLAYVVNQGSASVSVIDTALQSVVDTVTLPPGSKPNHIAIAPTGTYAYVSDTGNDCVYAIAIPADTIAATIPITVVQGLGMYGIAVAPNSATVYAVHDQDISVISAATDKVVATIVVGTITSDDFLETFPQIAAVSPDGGTLYVTVSDDLGSGPGALDEISTATNTVTRSVPLPDFTGEGLAIAPDGSRVYAVYGPIGRYNSHVAVINPATATTVAEVPVGQNNNDWSNPFDNAASTPDGGKVLVTNLANFDVSVIDTSTDTVVANVYVGGEPTGIAITPPITPITPAPDITSAPDQATNLTAAQFEFTGNSDECSLDGSDYQACAGAAEYTNLADGPHTFKVREHITGEDPGPDTDYTWSIYTQPPTVEIDSAPTGSGNGATATITFHATAEDGNDSAIAFHCSLDGAAWQPCTSPDSVAGLSDGVHSISVYATDDVGNVSSSAASAAWGVASGPGGTQPPPPSRCSGATLDSVTNGDLTMVARGGGCITPAQRGGTVVWEATGEVTLNGITIKPDPGTAVTLTQTGAAPTFASTGGASVSLDPLPAVHLPKVAWVQGAGGAIQMGTSLINSLAGLSSRVDASVDFTPRNGGTASFSVAVTLPLQFSDVPEGSIPGEPTDEVEATLTLETSNDDGLQVGGKVSVPSAYIGELHIKNLLLAFDPVEEKFDGNLEVWLSDTGPSIMASITLGPPGPQSVFGCCVEALSIGLQNINKQIPDTPLYLQSIGGSVAGGSPALPSVTVTGTAGVTIGPKFQKLPAIASIDGSLSFTFGDPWQLSISGNGSVASFGLVGATALYTSGGALQLLGTLDATFEGYGIKAELTPATFFQGTSNFTLDATGSVLLGVLGSQEGELVWSDHGVAACATVNTPTGSYQLGWGESVTGTIQKFQGVCDMGPYRSTIVVSGGARDSAVPHPLRIRLRPHAGQQLIALHGAGAAPQIRMTGPGGFALDGSTPIGRDGLVIPDPSTDTTYIMLRGAHPGVYAVTATNTAITSASTAQSLPAVSVRVTTRSLGHGKRLLIYSQRTAPGRRLELFEQGRPGLARLLTRTTRARGRLVYRPATGLGTTRTIRVLTLDAGLPDGDRTLARYRVNDSPPGRISAPRRHARQLRWKRAARAVAYVISFLTPNGTTPARTTKKRSVQIPPGATAATIVALDGAGRPGPAVSVKLP